MYIIPNQYVIIFLKQKRPNNNFSRNLQIDKEYFYSKEVLLNLKTKDKKAEHT